MPFGTVQLSPDTRNDGSWDGCADYHLSDSSILGFSHTHLSGVGVPDYGDILLLPITGEVRLAPGDPKVRYSGYRSAFRHGTEHAEPGYYTVFLDDYQVKAELTATDRVGFHRYTFAQLTRWQLDPTSRFEFVEKRARRHIFDLVGVIEPLPLSAQFQSQTATAPIRLIDNQTSHLSEDLRWQLDLELRPR